MDRKESPLVTGTAPWNDDVPVTADEQQAVETPEPRSELPTLPSTGKKKRTHRKLGPFDRRGFNANLPVVVVRAARRLAVDWDCDLQDVAEVALLALFDHEGIEIPRTQAEYDRMIREGRL